jgi:hypothetical protein
MADTAMRHPNSLAALAIVRDRSVYSQSSNIRSVAIFTVVKSSGFGARFALHHHGFDRTTTRAEIIEAIAARIPPDATVIARMQRMPQHFPRYSAALAEPIPPGDLQLIQRLRPDLDVLSLRCRSRTLDETAAAFAIRRAGPGSSLLAQARLAPEEAQCLWLAFLRTLCRETDRIWLGSAWEAWRALQRARPLSF